MSSKVNNNRPSRASQKPPKTPLTAISKTFSENIGTISKTVTVATTSGVMLTVGLPGQALADVPNSGGVSSTDTSAHQILDVDPADYLGELKVAFSPSPVTDAVAETTKEADNAARSAFVRKTEVNISVLEPEPEPVSEVVAAGGVAVPVTNFSAPAASSYVPVTDSSVGAAVIAKARQGLGVPYVGGGSSPAGWDCSGYVSWVFQQAVGKTLPRTSQGMSGAGYNVSQAEAQPGDLVIMNGGGHVAIYAGAGKIYESSVPGKPTSLNNLWGSGNKFVRVL